MQRWAYAELAETMIRERLALVLQGRREKAMANVYINQAGEIVPEGTDGAMLAHSEGSEPDDARLNEIRPGLAAEIRAQIEKAKAEKPPEDKAVEGPPEDKSTGRRR